MTDGRFALGITNRRPASEVVEGVSLAEKLGAETAFVAEDLYNRDAFLLLGLAAQATNHIRLSTGVVNPYTRHPASLAMAVATLDEVSGGRAQLAMGTSTPTMIAGQLGIPLGQSVARMREATEVVRLLLTGDEVTYEGKEFSLAGARLEIAPVQSRLPIFFAAMGPQMLHLVGELADGVLLNVGASPQYVRWAVEQIEEGLRRAGRSRADLTVAAWITAYLTDDSASGLQRAREWLATMLSIPRQGELLLEKGGFDASILPEIRLHVSGYPHGGNPAAAARLIPAEVAEAAAIIGPAEVARARIEEYRDAGVDLPVLSIGTLRKLYKKD